MDTFTNEDQGDLVLQEAIEWWGTCILIKV